MVINGLDTNRAIIAPMMGVIEFNEVFSAGDLAKLDLPHKSPLIPRRKLTGGPGELV